MNLNLTILGQAISFGLFVWFCMKFVWPPIITAMQERQAKIADGLAAAEKGAEAQELAQKEADELVAAAKSQASEIISQAQKRSNSMVEEAKDEARTEAEKVKQSAQADIEQEVVAARENLRGQVSTLAVAGASRILSKEIDENAHAKALDDLIAQI
ncbi:MAG: F0F1 ATP synthase subunit B [Granulosicoccaceae bacterium]